jgi:hypothetical protein
VTIRNGGRYCVGGYLFAFLDLGDRELTVHAIGVELDLVADLHLLTDRTAARASDGQPADWRVPS